MNLKKVDEPSYPQQAQDIQRIIPLEKIAKEPFST